MYRELFPPVETGGYRLYDPSGVMPFRNSGAIPLDLEITPRSPQAQDQAESSNIRIPGGAATQTVTFGAANVGRLAPMGAPCRVRPFPNSPRIPPHSNN